MYSKVLVVIDMQNDFITGSLGNRECVEAVSEVCKTIERGSYDFIYVTMDTHGEDYLGTQEGVNLPVEHCILGTEGWQLVPEVQKALGPKRFKAFVKGTFGSIDLAEAIAQGCSPDAEVDFVGVCTDICVISNAMVVKARNPEMRLSVIAKACAGTSKENHEAALTAMRSCQIRVV